MILFGRAAHRVAVAVADAMAFIDKIEMRVDLHDMDRTMICKGAHTGDVDRVVAAKGDGDRTGGKRGTHTGLDIGMACVGVGVDDVGIAHVDDLGAGPKIGDIIFMVVGPGMAKSEERGGLSNAARPKPRARPPLCAKVERRAKNGDIGIDLGPIGLVFIFSKGGDAHKGKVETTRFVTM